MLTNLVFSFSNICVSCETKKGKLNLFLLCSLRTLLNRMSEISEKNVIGCIFSENSHVHFSLFCVCMPFPLVVSPLYNWL